MTEVDDMREEVEYIMKAWMNISNLRRALQKKAIMKMTRNEDVDAMVEILRITKRDSEDDE